MEEKLSENRREALMKIGHASAYVIPTIVTFSIGSLSVAASGGQTAGFQNIQKIIPELELF